jgi:hypothetical protein
MALLRPIGTNGGGSIAGPDVNSSTPFNYSIVLSRLSIAVTRGLVAIGDIKFSEIKWTISANRESTGQKWPIRSPRQQIQRIWQKNSVIENS